MSLLGAFWSTSLVWPTYFRNTYPPLVCAYVKHLCWTHLIFTMFMVWVFFFCWVELKPQFLILTIIIQKTSGTIFNVLICLILIESNGGYKLLQIYQVTKQNIKIQIRQTTLTGSPLPIKISSHVYHPNNVLWTVCIIAEHFKTS